MGPEGPAPGCGSGNHVPCRAQLYGNSLHRESTQLLILHNLYIRQMYQKQLIYIKRLYKNYSSISIIMLEVFIIIIFNMQVNFPKVYLPHSEN